MALNKVITNSLSDGSVTTSKIEDGAVTAGKISDATTISISKTLIGSLPPTISSLSTDQIDPDTGATVTITGTRFVSIPEVKFVNTTTGARITATTVTYTSSTTIAAAFPTGQTPGIYKVQVENPDGQGVLSSATITYSIAPLWSTAAGSLGSVEEGESVNFSLLAYDDDSTAVSSYTLQSGSLPSGVTLSGDSSVGSITGTAPEVSADTSYNFTIRATDNESQTSDRAFSMTVTDWLLANSIRLNDSSSDYLKRVNGSTGNREKWTFSTWIKRTLSGGGNDIIIYPHNGGSSVNLAFNGTNTLYMDIGGVGRMFETNMLFRDPSAWYHIVVAFNTTDYSTVSAGQVKVYVNNVEQTFLSTTNLSQGYDSSMNNAGDIAIGRDEGADNNYADHYLSQVYLIDGQQLTPSSFGETDATSGIWIPKKYTGSYGTNGFKLDFTNSSSLGADSSGNSNDFTVYNLTSIDQVTDTPQNNYATFNPLSTVFTADISSMLSEGNTKYTPSGATYSIVKSTIPFPKAGKWYVEAKLGTGSIVGQFGIMRLPATSYATDSFLAYQCNDYCYHYGQNGVINKGSSSQTNVATGLTTWSASDTLAMLFDADNNLVKWYNNDTLIYTLDLSSAPDGYYANDGEWVLATSSYGGSQVTNINFGNPSISIVSGNSDADGYGNFEYSTKGGYALNTKNLANYG